MLKLIRSTLSILGTLFLTTAALAQDPAAEDSQPSNKTLLQDVDGVKRHLIVMEQGSTTPEQEQLYKKFSKLLTGAKLKGQFTVDGRPMNDLKEDTYEIAKVEKLAEGDLWVITARIQYGEKDITFPVPLEVKWAGSTPVLTLDNMTIPGFGTFGARIVFHKDKYAGTWQHDDVGGHMFGLIELAPESDAATKEAPPTDAKPVTEPAAGSVGPIGIDK